MGTWMVLRYQSTRRKCGKVTIFQYLDSIIAENGDMDVEMTHIIQSGWKNWKSVSGVMCDRRISLSVKGKYTIRLKDQV